MKTLSTIVLFLLASFIFGQKVSDTTFTTKHNKETNIRLSKRWFNELQDARRISFSDKNDELIASFLWLGKTDYFNKKNNQSIIVDVQLDVTLKFVDSRITIWVEAIEFKSYGSKDKDVQNDLLYFDVLKANTKKMFADFEKYLNVQNSVAAINPMSEGIDILLKAENQTDIAVGLSIASGLVGSIVATNNPTAGLVITAVGGAVGLVIWIGSRVNKRIGLKKLKGAA
jgi:hypothetical protein